METASIDDDSDAPNDSINFPLGNCLNCFDCYIPADTLQPRWFLVQVSLDDSSNGKNTGIYFCSFLQNHTSDQIKSATRKRWRPEWRELVWLPDDRCYDY